MAVAPPRARIVRMSVGSTAWEVATRASCPPLSGHIQELMGYLERVPGGMRRREYPIPGVVVIIDLGPALRMRLGGGAVQSHRGGFVSGLGTRYADTEHDGVQHGIQLNLHPLGAARLLGMPLGELTGQVVSFVDLLPRTHARLTERLAELPSWDARFDLLEAVLRERLQGHEGTRADIAWAANKVMATAGQLDTRGLARELGYSHKHMITLFRTHVGLPPKLLSRLVRFARLMQVLKQGAPAPWAQLAVELGYYDQAHLARDVREFAGDTPGSLRALVAPLAPLFG